MSYKMLMNKQKFMKTEFGQELEGVIRAWDMALEQSREDSATLRDLAWCQAQWEVYRLAMKQFYGVEYHFTRTDEYFGVCTEDECDYLLKIDRTESIIQKVTRRGVRVCGKEYWNDDLMIRFLGAEVKVEIGKAVISVSELNGNPICTFER